MEFDLGQKWAKGLRLSFLNAQESGEFRNSVEFEKSYSLKQIHSAKLINWSATTPPATYSQTEGDGFIVRGDSFKRAKKKLVVRTADCAPLFFVDRENECAASIHAGWPGLARRIHEMPFKEGFNPKTTWIWCGPCLNGASFEVGEDMWTQFAPAVQKDSAIFADRIEGGQTAAPGKKYFYMWKFLESEFKRMGVELFYNVEVDTFSDTNYNSYRRFKKEAGTPPLPHNYSWMSFV